MSVEPELAGGGDRDVPVQTTQVVAHREAVKSEITRGEEDSDTVREIALALAPALEYNPRRLKQFLNLFRLRTFIAVETGLFDPPSSLTLEQLAKFVLIHLKWPWFLSDLERDGALLEEVQLTAWGSTEGTSVRAQRWAKRVDFMEFLSIGCQGGQDGSPDLEKWSLLNVDAERLLQVSPFRRRIEKAELEEDSPKSDRPERGADIDLVKIEGNSWVLLDGTFTMGSEDGEKGESPAHQVTLSPYRISRYPVTNRQYLGFVTETGREAPGDWTEGQIPEVRKTDPVVNVSWGDAEAYCTWLTKKVGEGLVSLPTEAQWEFAARGAEGRKYPWGAEEPDERRANFAGRLPGTSPVDAYPEGATPTGISDLSGNVWEWCRDWHGPYRADPVPDPTGPDEGDRRVLRGGSFRSGPHFLRAAFRSLNLPDDRSGGRGFRVVWSAAGGQD